MRILVTGGAGFVGSHLVDALIALGHKVRVLDSLEPQVHVPEARPPDYLNRGAKLQVGDVRDHSAVARALDGVEVVFHLAAAVGVGQSMYEMERFVSVDSVGAAVLLEGVVQRRERIRKLIVASSMSAYGEGSYRNDDGEIVYPALRVEEQLRHRLRRVADLLADEFGVGEPPEIPEHFRAGDIRHCFADITKIHRELGYVPRVSLAEGLHELLAWLRTQKAQDRVEEARRELERRGLSQ